VAANVAKKILGVVGTGAFAVTLMACYGPAPRGGPVRPEPPAPSQGSDGSGGVLEPLPTAPAASSASPYAKPPPGSK
jgi:hypothetical protein